MPKTRASRGKNILLEGKKNFPRGRAKNSLWKIAYNGLMPILYEYAESAICSLEFNT